MRPYTTGFLKKIPGRNEDAPRSVCANEKSECAADSRILKFEIESSLKSRRQKYRDLSNLVFLKGRLAIHHCDSTMLFFKD